MHTWSSSNIPSKSDAPLSPNSPREHLGTWGNVAIVLSGVEGSPAMLR